MKQNLKLFVVALLGGLISLAVYNRFFQKEVRVVEKVQEQLPVFTSNTPSVIVAAESLTDFTKAAELTLNAVVHVKNTAIGVQRDPFAELFFGRGYSGKEYERVGTGSGVVISPDGYIITNNHVIEGASEIEISLNNQQKYKAELIGADKNTDIALLKIETEDDLDFLTFGDSDVSKIGEWVLAVGNPYNLTSTVTAGIISAKGRDLEGNRNIESFIQTDAAVNPGNSGGALVNTKGELIGINTAISSQTGSFVGYSFAVPSNIAKRVIEDLMENGSVKRAVLGVTTQPKENIDGVYIAEVSKGSGADKAGMQAEDVIKKINNVKIHKFSDLVGQLVAKRPGDAVLVTIDREGEEKVLKVKLSEVTTFVRTAYGMQFGELKAQEKQDLQISGGVKVTEINNKDLQKIGIKPGYIILSINNYPIQSVTDIDRIKKVVASDEKINKLVVINLKGERETFSRGW